jgi:hypothetical protein
LTSDIQAEAEKISYRIGYIDGATRQPPQVELTEPEKLVVARLTPR